jgi:hypothetical protein
LSARIVSFEDGIMGDMASTWSGGAIDQSRQAGDWASADIVHRRPPSDEKG